MSNARGSITVGVDIGTTSVKALAVDQDGEVVARARVAHEVMAPEPDLLRHDARKAWRAGPRRAYGEVTKQLAASGNGEVAGLSVASMVPSLTAVNRRGIPVLPGLMYGDVEGRPSEDEASRNDGLPPIGAMPDAEGFLRWGVREAPDARGYWPCQAVATHALTGVPAVDTGVVASMGQLHVWGKWNSDLLDTIGVREAQLPTVVPMCEAGGTVPGTDTVFTGGSIDALCDQIVSGATEPGDVLAIFRRNPHCLGRHRRVAPGPRAHQLPPYDAGPVLDRGTEQCRCTLRRLGQKPVAWGAPPGAGSRNSPRGWAIRTGSRCGCPTSEESALPSTTTRFVRTSTGSISLQTVRPSNGPHSRPVAS